MPQHRPFRFGSEMLRANSASDWLETARRVEAHGYSTLLMPDHFAPIYAPIAALTSAVMATTSLRVGTTVFANDFRHPVVLAKEMATLDVLSEGRVEVGIGAGWKKAEYEQAGIPFDDPSVRVERMTEAVQILKGLWRDEPFSFSGAHYSIVEMDGWPKPAQQPHPPIYVGAGAKRMLSFAAREADIVGIIARALPGGGLDSRQDTEELLAEKIDHVREAAGNRLGQIELSMLLNAVVVSGNVARATDDLAARWGWEREEIEASPYFLIGSVAGVADRLHELRERYGISYFTVFPQDAEAFAPVVARLAGT